MKMWTALLLATAFCPVALAEFPYRGCFDLASRRHKIDLDLLLAVASVESNWDADARSPANAHGVMQIRWPLTAKHLGIRRVAELYNPCLNINLGAQYLRELSNIYGGDDDLMLAAYNYGPGRIRSRKDIPVRVRRYVDRVTSRRAKISGQMNELAGANLVSGDVIEVIRFDYRSRAKRYLRGLQNQVPDAEFTIDTRPGKNIIYLDTASLTAESRYRLTGLLPKY
jgi:membrane-bound lytic murein transglycosylase MltF